MKIKIYTGLSMSKSDLKKLAPNYIFSKPVARTDLKEDIKNGIHIIGLVDGVFLNQLAVSPSEIMDCIRHGIKVFGSSSMGALRAAELDQYGMVGVGDIYNLVKKNEDFEDDFLGQTFYEDDLDKRSTPFIDVYLVLKKLHAENVISKDVMSFAIRKFRNMHYSDRGVPRLLDVLSRSRFHDQLKESFYTRMKKMKSTKQEDAIRLVRTIQDYQRSLQIYYRT